MEAQGLPVTLPTAADNYPFTCEGEPVRISCAIASSVSGRQEEYSVTRRGSMAAKSLRDATRAQHNIAAVPADGNTA